MFAGAAGLIYADEPFADLCRLIPIIVKGCDESILGAKYQVNSTKNVQRDF